MHSQSPQVVQCGLVIVSDPHLYTLQQEDIVYLSLSGDLNTHIYPSTHNISYIGTCIHRRDYTHRLIFRWQNHQIHSIFALKHSNDVSMLQITNNGAVYLYNLE